jgi:hypothetical protein
VKTVWRNEEKMPMSRTVMVALVAAGGISLSACATTTFNTTWTAPDTQPIRVEPGDKVIAMVMSPNEATRRGAETALASELSRRGGVEAIPSYTVIPDDAVQDKEKARPYIDKTGARYAVVMRATGKDKEISGSGSMYTGPYYGGFWGGYYGWGWGAAYSPGYLRTDTVVSVETLVYDLESNKLIWAGQSQTMNPSNAEKMIRELVDEAGREMKKQGLLTGR